MSLFENQDNEQRTEISRLGEFGLIDLITRQFRLQNPSSKKGVGDDAAVIDNHNLQTLVSVDLLVEGVHFDLSYTPLQHLGYKSAIVNISDIAAMNGKACQLVVGIALSSRFPVEAVENIYFGNGYRAGCCRRNLLPERGVAQ